MGDNYGLSPEYWLKRFSCLDCQKDTRNETQDYYMVLDALWNEFGQEPGMLCISCFEKRLGRALIKEDFTTAPVNELVLIELKLT